jgi:hypothetical protein
MAETTSTDFNSASRALRNRYPEGAFNTQYRLRLCLEDHRRPFDTLDMSQFGVSQAFVLHYCELAK